MFSRALILIFNTLVASSLALLGAGCGLTRSQKPNVLIIALDSLGVNDINCSREAKPLSKSGLDILCKSAVRFTHAYTPSLLSEPALASLLTGLYPTEHKVHNNGPDYLRVNLPNIATAAYDQGYRTSFFSGGPPALRSSGMQQGFELFDDNISPTIKLIFRPADVTFSLFTVWAKEIDAAFFSVIYAPDLLFVGRETTDEFGEKRNLSRESQIDNFDNSLGQMFSQMKKDKIWDQTNIVLVGLNGSTDKNSSMKFPKTDLRSEQTQVSLLIKPAGKPRDEGLSWSFDDAVSLSDVGRTIFEWLNVTPSQNSKLPVYSLASEVLKPGSSLQKARWIYSESYWGPWKKQAGPSFSLRKNNILFVQSSRRHFFNTLTDRMESSEIPSDDPSVKSISVDLEATKKMLGISSEEVSETWKEEPEISYSDKALALLLESNWKELSQLGQQKNNPDWIALGERNLGINKTRFVNPCLQLMDELKPSQEERRFCPDKNTLILSDFISVLNTTEDPGSSNNPDSIDQRNRDYHRRKLAAVLKDELLFSHLESTNRNFGDIWNLSEHRKIEHLNFELALRHPRANKIHLIQ